jgi:hypothetical protein
MSSDHITRGDVIGALESFADSVPEGLRQIRELHDHGLLNDDLLEQASVGMNSLQVIVNDLAAFLRGCSNEGITGFYADLNKSSLAVALDKYQESIDHRLTLAQDMYEDGVLSEEQMGSIVDQARAEQEKVGETAAMLRA